MNSILSSFVLATLIYQKSVYIECTSEFILLAAESVYSLYHIAFRFLFVLLGNSKNQWKWRYIYELVRFEFILCRKAITFFFDNRFVVSFL